MVAPRSAASPARGFFFNFFYEFFFLILDDFFSEPFFFSFGCKKNFKVFFIFNVKVFSLNFFCLFFEIFFQTFSRQIFFASSFFPLKIFYHKTTKKLL